MNPDARYHPYHRPPQSGEQHVGLPSPYRPEAHGGPPPPYQPPAPGQDAALTTPGGDGIAPRKPRVSRFHDAPPAGELPAQGQRAPLPEHVYRREPSAGWDDARRQHRDSGFSPAPSGGPMRSEGGSLTRHDLAALRMAEERQRQQGGGAQHHYQGMPPYHHLAPSQHDPHGHGGRWGEGSPRGPPPGSWDGDGLRRRQSEGFSDGHAGDPGLGTPGRVLWGGDGRREEGGAVGAAERRGPPGQPGTPSAYRPPLGGVASSPLPGAQPYAPSGEQAAPAWSHAGGGSAMVRHEDAHASMPGGAPPGSWGGPQGGALGAGHHPMHQRVGQLSVQLPPGGGAAMRSPAGGWDHKRAGDAGSPVRPGPGMWDGATHSPRYGAHLQSPAPGGISSPRGGPPGLGHGWGPAGGMGTPRSVPETPRYTPTGVPEIDRLEVQLRQAKDETRAAADRSFAAYQERQAADFRTAVAALDVQLAETAYQAVRKQVVELIV